MSALDLVTTARDATFAARVNQIAVKVAVNVANEGDNAPDHAVRMGFANKVLSGQANGKLMASAIIASNGSISATIESAPELRGSNVPDGDIEFAFAGIVTALGHANLS
jgi:hypothetical protein